MAKQQPAAPSPGASGDVPFEHCLQELEQIVSQLEAGEKPLDESLALYEKGIAALKRCHAILDKAEQRIRMLVKSPDGTPTLRDAELTPHSGSSRRQGGVVATTPSAPSEEVFEEAETEIDLIEEPADDAGSTARPPQASAPSKKPKSSGRRDSNSLFRSNE
jgi:exodeoxyribonuclease VII small subunit